MPVIRVSFKDTDPDEMQLHNDILELSKYVGLSGWMKQAAAEKRDREREQKKSSDNGGMNMGSIVI